MISRKHRFRGEKDINYIYKKGRTVRAGFMGAKVLPAKKDDYRLAVVVSRKVDKSAVVRNRIRRRLYEQFRLFRKNYGHDFRYDIVLTVYERRAAEMPSDELSQVCQRLIQQIQKVSN